MYEGLKKQLGYVRDNWETAGAAAVMIAASVIYIQYDGFERLANRLHQPSELERRLDVAPINSDH